MKTIFKYEINITDRVVIEMPPHSIIRHIDNQRDRVYIWAEIDTDNIVRSYPRIFRFFGTGHEIPSELKLNYIGTIKLHDGTLIFHLYEEF